MKIKLLFFMLSTVFFACASDYSDEEDQDTARAFGVLLSADYEEDELWEKVILVASDDDELMRARTADPSAQRAELSWPLHIVRLTLILIGPWNLFYIFD